MKFVNVFIGKKLKEAMQAKNLSQASFAEKINVSTTAVSRWVNGVCLPEDQRQDEIFETLGVDEHFFFNTNPTPSITSAQVAEIQKALNKSTNDQIYAKVSTLEQELKKRDQEISNLKAKIKRLSKSDDFIDIDENHPEFKRISEIIRQETKSPSNRDPQEVIEELFPTRAPITKKKDSAG